MEHYASLCKDAEGLIWFNQADLIMAYSLSRFCRDRTCKLTYLMGRGDSIWVADQAFGTIRTVTCTPSTVVRGTYRPSRAQRSGWHDHGSALTLSGNGQRGLAFRSRYAFRWLCVRTIEVIGSAIGGTYIGHTIVLKDKSMSCQWYGALNHIRSLIALRTYGYTNKGPVRTTLPISPPT
jgi:hypothetical protein